jgi:hypothetical protein
MLPRAVEGLGDIDFARAGFADVDCVAAIRQSQGADIVTSTAVVAWPAKAFVFVRPEKGIGRGMNRD